MQIHPEGTSDLRILHRFENLPDDLRVKDQAGMKGYDNASSALNRSLKYPSRS